MKVADSKIITNIPLIKNKDIPFWEYTSGKYRPNAPKQWDICYKYEYPYNVLCNFTPSHFFFDGIEIYSMEGFLQALKVNDPKIQRKVCTLPGFLAKKLGNYLKRSGKFDKEHLYWNGKTYNRNSKEYQDLLNRVYEAKFLQDKEFRNVLKLSKGYKLTHDIGKSNPHETILTDKEFVDNLDLLRNREINISPIECLVNGINKYLHKSSPSFIPKTFKEIKTTFINSHFICGEPLFNKKNSKYINRKSRIFNIIDVNNDDSNPQKRKLFCQKHGLGYVNITPETMRNLDTIKQLIKIYNSGELSYISSIKREYANFPLVINYLFNPKSDISDAIIFGTPTKKFIRKMKSIGKEIYTQTDSKDLSEISTVNSFMEKLKILSELN